MLGGGSSSSNDIGTPDVMSSQAGPISLQTPATSQADQTQAGQTSSQNDSQSVDIKPVVRVSIQGSNVSCNVTLTTLDKDSVKSVQISTAADSSTGATLGSASDRSQTPSIASTSHRSQTPSVTSQVFGSWMGATASQDNQAATSQPAVATSSNPTQQTASSSSTTQVVAASTAQADSSSNTTSASVSTSSSNVVLSVPVVNASTSVSDPVERITAWLKDTSSQSGGGGSSSTQQQAQPIVIQPVAQTVPPSPTISQDPWANPASSVVPTSASSGFQGGSQGAFSAYGGVNSQQSSLSIPPHVPLTCPGPKCPPPLPIQSGHINSTNSLLSNTLGVPPPAHMNLTTYMNPLTLAAPYINLHPLRSNRGPKPPSSYIPAGVTSSNTSGDSSQNKDKLHIHSMFLSKVLVGCYTQGSSGLRKPPPLDPNDPYGKAYDSCVDNVYDPRVFVVFDSAQCYPEYVIEYTNDPGMLDY